MVTPASSETRDQELARLREELNREQEKRKLADKRRAAKRKAQGYTHRIVAWVHPTYGDDYQIEAFTVGEPTADTMRQLLKRSTIKDDYRIETL